MPTTSTPYPSTRMARHTYQQTISELTFGTWMSQIKASVRDSLSQVWLEEAYFTNFDGNNHL